MKKFIPIIILSIFLFLPRCALAEELNYEQIYKNLPVVQNDYINSEDPYEYDDYQKYFTSPYPLLRIWANLYFKNLTIREGYYLLTPREKDGQNVILFKQNGRIAFIIPVFEKKKINPALVYKEPPKPKTPWYKVPWKCFKAGMAHMFGLDKTPPKLPKSLIETSYVGGPYFEMDFYYDEYLYKAIFSTEKIQDNL